MNYFDEVSLAVTALPDPSADTQISEPAGT